MSFSEDGRPSSSLPPAGAFLPNVAIALLSDTDPGQNFDHTRVTYGSRTGHARVTHVSLRK